MLELKIEGVSPEDILLDVARAYPKIHQVLETVRMNVGGIKVRREVYPYQAACIFMLARQYARANTRLLEIGTAVGYSGSIIAEAIKVNTTSSNHPRLITLNPKKLEAEIAIANLERYRHVTVKQRTSGAYLVNLSASFRFDMIFVDGDHANVMADMPYFNHLKRDGLMLFHDYSRPDSPRECPPVFNACNWLSEALGRVADVVVVDDTGVGMIGWYRRANEKLRLDVS